MFEIYHFIPHTITHFEKFAVDYESMQLIVYFSNLAMEKVQIIFSDI